MPASKPKSLAAQRGDAVAQVDAACRQVVAGKLAARLLGAWVRELGVSDSEFRLLWQLERELNAATESAASRKPLPPDQAMLAERLAVSPAQMSGMVERLSAEGLIEPDRSTKDRRRQAWRISLAGQLLVSNVIARVNPLLAPAAAEQEAA